MRGLILRILAEKYTFLIVVTSLLTKSPFLLLQLTAKRFAEVMVVTFTGASPHARCAFVHTSTRVLSASAYAAGPHNNIQNTTYILFSSNRIFMKKMLGCILPVTVLARY